MSLGFDFLAISAPWLDCWALEWGRLGIQYLDSPLNMRKDSLAEVKVLIGCLRWSFEYGLWLPAQFVSSPWVGTFINEGTYFRDVAQELFEPTLTATANTVSSSLNLPPACNIFLRSRAFYALLP